MCKFYAKGKCLLGESCTWKHEDPKGGTAAWGHSDDHNAHKLPNSIPHRVLVETGANQLIRPNSEQWWIDIMYGTVTGKGLHAAGRTCCGARVLTKLGEVMMKEGMRNND